jgi:hypothetical protein
MLPVTPASAADEDLVPPRLALWASTFFANDEALRNLAGGLEALTRGRLVAFYSGCRCT